MYGSVFVCMYAPADSSKIVCVLRTLSCPYCKNTLPTTAAVALAIATAFRCFCHCCIYCSCSCQRNFDVIYGLSNTWLLLLNKISPEELETSILTSRAATILGKPAYGQAVATDMNCQELPGLYSCWFVYSSKKLCDQG